jgi:hypothetical protein
MDVSAAEKLVFQLNEDWFQQKKHWFQREPFYDKDLEKIYDGIPGNDEYDEEGNWIGKEDDIVIDKDLASYCYSSNFYGSLSSTDPPEHVLPIDGSDVTYEIMKLLSRYIEQLVSPKAKNNCIVLFIDAIRNQINVLLEKNNDDVYEGALENFLFKTRQEISRKYHYIKTEVELLDDFQDTLNFNLTQEKLVALLYILNKAGVFNTLNYNDTTFLRVCQQYFAFRLKSNYQRPKNLKTFTDKYREFVRGENGKNLDEMKNMLIRTIKEI